jgi:hypothetical protein
MYVTTLAFQKRYSSTKPYLSHGKTISEGTTLDEREDGSLSKRLFKPNVIGKKSIEHSSRSAKQSIPKAQASLNRTPKKNHIWLRVLYRIYL